MVKDQKLINEHQIGIAIIIVLYYPNIDNINSSISSIGSNRLIILIDNTPNLENDSLIGKINVDNQSKIIYLPQKLNLGIAEAQNIGIQWIYSNQNSISHLLFLDQDSLIDSKFLDAMLNEYLRISKFDIKIGALGPEVIESDTLLPYKSDKSISSKSKLKDFKIVSKIISSGMLISLDTIKEVGFMKRDLFIDLVDFEWCWRANTFGYKNCITQRVQMAHKVGLELKYFLGIPFILSSPFRYYYQTRNYIILLFINYVPLKWKFINGLKKLFTLFIIAFISPNGSKSLQFMIKGFFDGFLKRKKIDE